jgi:hypothetical protein
MCDVFYKSYCKYLQATNYNLKASKENLFYQNSLYNKIDDN